MKNIYINSSGTDGRCAVTGLRSGTHFGRPNWDQFFGMVRDKHPGEDVGVFFCGPKVLSKVLHKSNSLKVPQMELVSIMERKTSKMRLSFFQLYIGKINQVSSSVICSCSHRSFLLTDSIFAPHQKEAEKEGARDRT